MQNLWQNLKFAGRQLQRNPGFTLAVVVTLTLAIGANTAIFSLVNALLLKSLPYPEPQRMGTIYAHVAGARGGSYLLNLDGEAWELLRDNAPSLISAVSGGTSGVNLKAGSHVQYLREGRVSLHYFEVLGVPMLFGRNFSADDDRPHGPKAAILSYALWHNTFGADPAILGQSILLKGEPYTVIGVLPQHATTPSNADLFTPLQASREGEGGGTNFDVLTRLRPGANWVQADGEINQAWAVRAHRFAAQSPGSSISYFSVPFQKGQTDALQPQVLGLMLAAGSILLIACANLAGLTMVSVLRRSSEVVTRLALGASPWQIQKQFWIENLLLALCGGAVGVAAGFAALRGLLTLLPEHFLPVASVPLDARVLGFTFAATVLTSILFGMLPTLEARRIDLRSGMAGRSVAGGGGVRLRQSLIVGEVALTVVLLAASGLLVRTLIHLQTLAPGFNPNGVMAAKASLDELRFHDPANFRKLLDESTAAMRQIPGVQNAAVGLTLPYERALNDGVTLSDGKEAGQQDGTDVIYVTPGYFDTLRMPLIAGRVFTEADGPNTQRVVVVNQAFPRKFYGGANPVGRHINQDALIVGEVADVSVSSGLYEGAPLMSEQAMYIPAAQADSHFLAIAHVWVQPDWVVRTSGSIAGLPAQMQAALTSVDPNLPFSGFYSMRDLLAQTLATQELEVALLGTMAALALLLSAVGIFALVANMVAQRTREIGIRIALGSTVGRAMVQIGRSGAGASLLGIVLGLAVSAGVLRVMRSVLYGVDVYDARTLVLVVLLLVLVTALAVVAPVLRVAKIDPVTALREE
jgi:macrolide transport system ATP-binding/permease protein